MNNKEYSKKMTILSNRLMHLKEAQQYVREQLQKILRLSVATSEQELNDLLKEEHDYVHLLAAKDHFEDYAPALTEGEVHELSQALEILSDEESEPFAQTEVFNTPLFKEYFLFEAIELQRQALRKGKEYRQGLVAQNTRNLRERLTVKIAAFEHICNEISNAYQKLDGFFLKCQSENELEKTARQIEGRVHYIKNLSKMKQEELEGAERLEDEFAADAVRSGKLLGWTNSENHSPRILANLPLEAFKEWLKFNAEIKIKGIEAWHRPRIWANMGMTKIVAGLISKGFNREEVKHGLLRLNQYFLYSAIVEQKSLLSKGASQEERDSALQKTCKTCLEFLGERQSQLQKQLCQLRGEGLDEFALPEFSLPQYTERSQIFNRPNVRRLHVDRKGAVIRFSLNDRRISGLEDGSPLSPGIETPHIFGGSSFNANS